MSSSCALFLKIHYLVSNNLINEIGSNANLKTTDLFLHLFEQKARLPETLTLKVQKCSTTDTYVQGTYVQGKVKKEIIKYI